MNKILLKRKLVEECLKVQTMNAENVETAMNEAQQSANEYGQARDRYDSFRIQLLGKRNMYAIQLEKAVEEIKILEKIDLTKENNDVNFGAVVITNEQKLFVSISLGNIQIENDFYFAISSMVPLFKPMQGLKKGDSFEFNGKNIRIIDLF